MSRTRHLLVLTAVTLGLTAAMWAAFDRRSPAANAAPGDATLRVAHFAPFAGAVITTSVTVQVNGGDLITGFVYPELEGPVLVPAGTYTVELVPTGAATPVYTETFDLMADTEYFVAATGFRNGYPLDLYPLVVDRTPLSDSGKVRITHLAPFAAGLENTAVDICTDAGTVVVPSLKYSETTGYVALAPGFYDLTISVGDGTCETDALDLPPFQLAAGDVGEVIARGLLDEGVEDALKLGVFAEGLTFVAERATLSVAHFAPFDSAVISTSVTVRVNGNNLLTDFVYPEVEGPVVVDAGTTTVEILPTGAETVAYSETFDLMADAEYFVTAIGGRNGFGLDLYPLVVDRTPMTDSGKIRITHLAPFASGLDNTAVDVCTDAGTVVVPNVKYGDTTGYLPLAAGLYDLTISVAGSACATDALDLPPFVLLDGQVAEVIARGLLDANVEGALQLGVYTDLSTRISLAHFAPFAGTITGTSVTVNVNGTDVLTDFVYPINTGYVLFSPDTYAVQIFPNGASVAADPAISGTVTVSPAIDYTLAAIGDVGNQPLDLLPMVDDNTAPATGKARLSVTHLAPFASALVATQVDVCVGTTAVIDNLEYGKSQTLEVDAGILDAFVALPGSNCLAPVLDLPPVVLKAGDIYRLYALGNNTTQPLTVAAYPDLTPAPQLRLPLLSLSETMTP